MDRPDDLIGLAEAAALLGINRGTLARWLKEGRIPALQYGPRGPYRVRHADVLAYISSSRVGQHRDQAEASGPGKDRGRRGRDQGARSRVFILEADPLALDPLRALLEADGYVVTSGTYLPESSTVIEALRPQVVVLDLAWGQQAGKALLEGLAREAAAAKIPVLVTSTDPRLRAEAVDLIPCAAHRDPATPPDIDALAAAVREILGPA